MNRWRFQLIVCASLSILAASGCNTPPTPTTLSSTTGAVVPKQPVSSDGAQQPAVYTSTDFNVGSYAEPEVKPSVAPYAITGDLSTVSNWKQFSSSFDPASQEMLRKNLFLVLDGDRHQMQYIYEENAYPANEKAPFLPSFITTDSVLHTYHIFYDYLLRSMESNSLATAVSDLTKSLLHGALDSYNSTHDPNLKRAALHNIAYLLVPAHVLGTDLAGLQIPQEAAAMAAAETKLVEAHTAAATSVSTGSKVDYTLFVPRGHYTRSDLLKRYFVAVVWYGTVSLPIRDADNKPLPEGFRQAALLGALFDTSNPTGDANSKLWKRIMDPTSFMVGASDDFTPQQFIAAVKPLAGGKPPESASDSDIAKMVDAAAKASPTAMINGKRANELGIRLMGQRYVLDGYILQNLVAPLVGSDSLPRNHPMGLDVIATIGNSKRAADLLDNMYKQKDLPNFDSQLEKMKQFAASLPTETWSSNAYYGWLDVLRNVVEPKGAGYPSFMLNDAWLDKSVNTALASWSELRHDTIAYSKQSAAEMGGGDDELKNPPPGGYVEPDVRTYTRLQFLLKQLNSGLSKLNMLDDSTKRPMDEFDKTLTMLISISNKELANQPISQDDDDAIRFYGSTMQSLTVFYKEIKVTRNGQTFSETNYDADHDMAVAADIHTDNLNNKALEEAVGHANVIYAVFPARGKLWIGRGAVFSYYEFEVPTASRLTDETWKSMLKAHTNPQQPEWVKSFQIHKKAAPVGEKQNDDQLDDARAGGT